MDKNAELYLHMDESDRPFEKNEKTRSLTKADKDFENNLLEKYGIHLATKPHDNDEHE